MFNMCRLPRLKLRCALHIPILPATKCLFSAATSFGRPCGAEDTKKLVPPVRPRPALSPFGKESAQHVRRRLCADSVIDLGGMMTLGLLKHPCAVGDAAGLRVL